MVFARPSQILKEAIFLLTERCNKTLVSQDNYEGINFGAMVNDSHFC